jgi:hypothetical protein
MSNEVTFLPVVHMNGTSAECLLEGYTKAMRAVGDALEALQQIEFNQRDYYCHPVAEAWTKARELRKAQAKQLSEIRQSMEDHVVHVQDIIDQKEARRRQHD